MTTRSAETSCGHREDLVADVGAHRAAYLDLDAAGGQLRGQAAQLLLVGEAVVHQRVAAGGVDHHDATGAEPRLLDAAVQRDLAVLVGRPAHHDHARAVVHRTFSSVWVSSVVMLWSAATAAGVGRSRRTANGATTAIDTIT